MKSRGYFVLDAVLALASALFAVQTARVYVWPPVWRDTGVNPGKTAGASAPGMSALTTAPRPGLTSYAVISSKNLFNPSRSDSDAVAAAPSAPPVPKPFLFGIVLRDDASIAYLEDPATKRVAGYRIGDAVAGGTVQTIAADRVVLKRAEGLVDVQLRDPGKPRPEPPRPAQAAQPGRPGPQAPGAAASGPQPVVRPPLPAPTAGVPRPNLLRRLPLPAASQPASGQDVPNPDVPNQDAPNQ